MTNQELLTAPRTALTPPERQKQFLLRVELSPMPCPACLQPVDALAASGVEIDDFDFAKADRAFVCPQCAAHLMKSPPHLGVNPGWHWQLEPVWLAERLEKARAYDREHPESL